MTCPRVLAGTPSCLGMGISTTVPTMRGQGMGVRSSHQLLPAKCSPRVRLPVYVSQHGPGMNGLPSLHAWVLTLTGCWTGHWLSLWTGAGLLP